MIDNYASGVALAEAIIADGAKRPLFISGSKEDYTIHERYRGFCDALNAHGMKIPHGNVLFNIFDGESAYEAVSRVITKGVEFDSVFLCTNFIIYGVLQALNENNFPVVSIGGFEKFAGMEILSGNLHVIDQNESLIGKMAFEKLHSLLKGEQIESGVIQAKLI